jgi:hypothetical protein
MSINSTLRAPVLARVRTICGNFSAACSVRSRLSGKHHFSRQLRSARRRRSGPIRRTADGAPAAGELAGTHHDPGCTGSGLCDRVSTSLWYCRLTGPRASRQSTARRERPCWRVSAESAAVPAPLLRMQQIEREASRLPARAHRPPAPHRSNPQDSRRRTGGGRARRHTTTTRGAPVCGTAGQQVHEHANQQHVASTHAGACPHNLRHLQRRLLRTQQIEREASFIPARAHRP